MSISFMATLFALSTIYHTPITDTSAITSLSGIITDAQSGEALPGVFVYLPDLKSGAISQADGRYLIKHLPRAKVMVQVSYIGYATIFESLDLTKFNQMNFPLNQAATEMNAVVVTGSSRPSEIRKSPVPIAAINTKEIDQSPGTNIINTLTVLPGVSAVSTGPNISKPFIRGLGYNRVLTLYDGVRQEGQQWGDEHGEEIDEYNVSRAEVIKGPASLIYGPDALAGVVNLLTAPPLPAGAIKGEALTEYQSNNRMIGSSLSMAGNADGFIWDGRISHKQATNYWNKIDGRVYGTAFNETDGSARIGLNRNWGYSHLTLDMFNDLQEVPDGSRDSATRQFTRQISDADTLRQIVPATDLTTYRIATLHQHIQHYRVVSSSNLILDGYKLAINLGYQRNIRQEYSHPQYPDQPGLSLLLNTFTYDVKAYLPEKNNWEATFGINGMLQHNGNHGTEFIIPDYSEFDAGPFVFMKKSLDKLDFSAGLRYDTRIFKNYSLYVKTEPSTGFDLPVNDANIPGAKGLFNAFSHNYSGLSGSFGFTWAVSSRLILKANVARGFRAPNIAEISANGIHPGTNIYQMGNQSFSPEFSLQEDIGLEYSAYHIEGSISIFRNDISHYIFNQKLLNHLGKDSIIAPGNETFRFVQSHARLYGGEAMLDIHPHPLDWVHFENSISVVYAENLGGNDVVLNDSTRYLPFIPPLHFHSELRIDFRKKISHIPYLYAKVFMDRYARQNRVYLASQTETPTPGYTLLNAAIGGDIANRKNRTIVSIILAVNNLADAAYQSHLSRLKYMEPYPGNATGHNGIYGMGRNVSLRLIFPIGGE